MPRGEGVSRLSSRREFALNADLQTESDMFQLQICFPSWQDVLTLNEVSLLAARLRVSTFPLLGEELSVIPDLRVHCRQPHGLLRRQVTRRGKMANARRLKAVDARSVLISGGSVATHRGDAQR